MTPERAAELLSIEKTCVQRQDTPDCNRDTCGCQNCDLIQNTEEIIEAYDLAIEELRWKAEVNKYGSELAAIIAHKNEADERSKQREKEIEEFWKQINRGDNT